MMLVLVSNLDERTKLAKAPKNPDMRAILGAGTSENIHYVSLPGDDTKTGKIPAKDSRRV